MSNEEPIAPASGPAPVTPPPAPGGGPSGGPSDGPSATPAAKRGDVPEPQVHADLPDRLWLCVRFPHLALESGTRTLAEDSPLVVVTGTASQARVVDLNPPARLAGIEPGMGLNAAHALAPSLVAVAHEERQVAKALERLAGWALQFTSLVSQAPPDALLLEVRGSLRLFGGHVNLARQVHRGLRRLGYRATLGLAPTPLAATWLARSDARQPAVLRQRELATALSALDLACLRWPETLVERLRGMGVRRLGDCLRLPRGGFARRFGRARLAELDRALGRAPDPVRPWQAPLEFSSHCELPAPMQATHLLEIAFERLLSELDAFLMTRQGAVRRLDAELVLENRNVHTFSVRLTSPVSDTQYLMDLLCERLDQQRVEAPVLEVALRARDIQLRQPGNGDLFDRSSGVEEDARRLLERLRTRLGEHNVHGIAQVADHRPEAAWHSVEPGERPGAAASRRRPLWMLQASQPLAVRDGGPWLSGPLVFEQGPERIESGWWDGADIRRDYFVARSREGQRLWVYEDRRGGGWYLHGIFA